MNFEKDICVLDLETTGPNPKEDKIVQISIAKWHKDEIEDIIQIHDGPAELLRNPNTTQIASDLKTMLINPGIPIPPGATEVHKITDEMVKGAPLFKQIAKGLYDFIFNCDMVTFNGLRFDMPLLYLELHRAGIIWDYKKVNLIDACNIYKINEPRTLEAAYKFYTGLDHVGAHDAQADVMATGKVFLAQLSQYKLLEKTPAEIALYSNFDKPVLDLSGCFTINDKKEIVFKFGKHKDKVAKTEKSYLQWMLNGGFAPDTLAIVQTLLYTL